MRVRSTSVVPYKYMQNTQGLPEREGTGFAAIVVDIGEDPSPHGATALAQVGAWATTPLAQDMRFRVIPCAVKSETEVMRAILAHLATLKPHVPVVVLRSNTTVLRITALQTWVRRWMAADRPIWAAAERTLPSAELPAWVPSLLIPKVSAVLPGWSAFSAPAAALQTALSTYAMTQGPHTISKWLTNNTDVYWDATPLLAVTTRPATFLKPGAPGANLYFSAGGSSIHSSNMWVVRAVCRTCVRDIVEVTVAIVMVLCIILALALPKPSP